MRGRGWRWNLIAAALAPGVLAGCVSGGVDALREPVVTGSLAIAGPMLGTVELAPRECASGEHEVFLGADFSAADSPFVVRLAVDPLTGPGVRIFDREARFDRALLLRQADCAAFHFSLERSGWQINDIYALRVELELDCALASGDTVAGRLASTSCW